MYAAVEADTKPTIGVMIRQLRKINVATIFALDRTGLIGSFIVTLPFALEGFNKGRGFNV